MKGHSRTVYFATGNRGKYIEAVRIAANYGIRLKHLQFEKLEIQSDDLAEIASFAARQASESKRCLVVSEDAGFFVEGLNGFPGPYSSYVFRALGTRGILKLMRAAKNRKASFRATVAYSAPGRPPRCFTGVVRGAVSKRPKGSYGFGFDPIFVPLQGDGRTFAEMSTSEKNVFSHRAKAFTRFSRWFISQ